MGLPGQVQAEYRDLFETTASDTEALLRWRNRALRFVLTPDSSTSNSGKAGTSSNCSQEGKAGTQNAHIRLFAVIS